MTSHNLFRHIATAIFLLVLLLGVGNPKVSVQAEGAIPFTKHTVGDQFDEAVDVYATDIDGDGDMDIIGAAANLGVYRWNNDGSENFERMEISNQFAYPRSVYATDVDGDGDTDVLGAGANVYGVQYVVWWENNGTTNWGWWHTIDSNFSGAYSVYATDMDDDGDIDVLAAARDADQIAWYENEFCPGSCNELPIADAGGPYETEEGSTVTLDASGSSDPDGDDLIYRWSVNSNICTIDDESALYASLTCADDGQFTATVAVSDGVNDLVSSDAIVTVHNAVPTIDTIAAPSDPVNINEQPLSVGVSYSDPGAGDTHAVTWDWGDDSTDTKHSVVSPASQDHTYAEAGVYPVQIIVSDDEGGSDSEIYEYVVLYDPEGGFVTGGGWIWSEPGWCQLDDLCAGAEGKASFGFVSKYKKGASVPTGNTEFNFQAGGLSFHSDTYQWLVVNQGGTNAQYKGTGTINGQPSPNGEAYKFLLWAKDDDPVYGDTFRIKVWYEDGGEVLVYDNGFDQAIGSGSIVIHIK
jgi:hypothetical protein